MGLRTLLQIQYLHTQFDAICTYRTWQGLNPWYLCQITSDLKFGDLPTTSPESRILKYVALFKSVEFIETCSIAQSKKFVSPLFHEQKSLIFVK